MITEKIINKASTMASEYDRISVSLFQSAFSLPYTEAVKLMEKLESRGIVGPAKGSYPRDVLKKKDNETKSGPLHVTIPSWIAYIFIGYLFWSIFYFIKQFILK